MVSKDPIPARPTTYPRPPLITRRLPPFRSSHCSEGFYVDEYAGCLECGVTDVWLGPILVLLALLLCGVAGWCVKDRVLKWVGAHEERISEYSQRATVTFVTLQVSTANVQS